MASSTLPGLPTALLAATNAATDLVYVAIDPFGATDDRKQDRTNFFAQIPVAVGLGRPSSITGNLLFYNANNANAITFRTDTPAAALTYVLPNASPTVGQVLSASAPAANIVTLTWATVAATPGGSNTQVQYNNAGAFGGITGITSDGTNLTAGSTNLRATSPRITTAILDANGLQVIGLTATGTAVNSINIANATTTNPVTLTTVGDASTGLTITCAGTGITTVTGNAILNAGTGATTIGEASLGAEQLRVSSISASRVALSVNSLANSTVDLAQFSANVDDTATVANLITVNCNSNGAGTSPLFGQSSTYTLESSTTDSRTAKQDWVYWKVATDASRASVVGISSVSAATLSERVLICPTRTLADGVATTILTQTLASNSSTGCVVQCTVTANDGAAYQSWTATIYFAAANNGGTMNAVASIAGTPAESSATGSLTVTVATTTGAGTASLQLNADSSLTDPGITVMFTVYNNGTQAIAITV